MCTGSGGPAAEENLLLMACSGAKLAEAAFAIDLYQGVMYESFRTHLNLRARPRILILSALHGFIDPYTFIQPYKQKMTPGRADHLIGAALDLEQWPTGIRRVFMAGGAEYRRVMLAAVQQLRAAGRVLPDALVEGTHGGIGYQRAQLGEYLRSLPVSTRLVGEHPNGTPLYQSLDGFSVGDDVVARYRPTEQGERAVIEELFFGPVGPTAAIVMQPEKPSRIDYRRWIGLRKLFPHATSATTSIQA